MRARSLALAILAGGCATSTAPSVLHEGSERCASCHDDHYDAWSTSRHASSAESPVFEAFLPLVEEAWGTSARDRCVGCHAPSHGGEGRVGCVSCHAAIGNTEEGNGALIVDLDRPVAITAGRLVEAPHATRSSDLLTSPTLCGTCHEVSDPPMFAEAILSDFRRQPAFQAGLTCASCHLVEHDGEGSSHSFVGLDPAWGQSEAAMASAAARTGSMLDHVVELGVTSSPRGGFEIRVTNVCPAHSFPAGSLGLRDVWVDVSATTEDGETLSIDRVIELSAILTRDGEMVALPTDADRIESRSLAPFESVSTHIELPSAVRLDAVVRVRAIRAEALDALGLADRAGEVPLYEIANATWVRELAGDP